MAVFGLRALSIKTKWSVVGLGLEKMAAKCVQEVLKIISRLESGLLSTKMGRSSRSLF
jgi:hypothetical protein